MKSIKLFLYLSVSFFCQCIISQNDTIKVKPVVTQKIIIENTPKANPLWDSFSIRKTFETKSENDEKAATISITHPKDKDEIFNINAGIGYTFPEKPDANHGFTAFVVYNKNTNIDKRQENYKIGVTHNYTHFTEKDFLFIKKDFGLINDNSIEYLNDNVKKAQSLVLLSYLSFRANTGWLILQSYATRESQFAYKLDPKVGMEYQNSYDVAKPLEDGYYLRSYFNVGGSFLIRKKTMMKTITTITNYKEDGKIVGKPEVKEAVTVLNKFAWNKGLEVSVNYEGRNSLADNFDDNPSYMYFFKGEIKLYPILDSNFSVGASYNKGENPLDGLDKQEFWMLSLNFKK